MLNCVSRHVCVCVCVFSTARRPSLCRRPPSLRRRGRPHRTLFPGLANPSSHLGREWFREVHFPTPLFPFGEGFTSPYPLLSMLMYFLFNPQMVVQAVVVRLLRRRAATICCFDVAFKEPPKEKSFIELDWTSQLSQYHCPALLSGRTPTDARNATEKRLPSKTTQREKGWRPKQRSANKCLHWCTSIYVYMYTCIRNHSHAVS